jgi:DNA-directed RNA polymerase subunit RPC12/RpoP
MKMFEVKVENTRFLYLTEGEVPYPAAPFTEIKVPPTEALENIARADDVRIAIFENPLRKGVGWVNFLFWPNHPQLADLDLKVCKGDYSDEDFAASVKTEYIRTICPQCGRSWPSLVIDSGNPYLGAPGLINRKIAQSRILRCPACGSSLRLLVVRIFET